jgi:hypothetical protein
VTHALPHKLNRISCELILPTMPGVLYTNQLIINKTKNIKIVDFKMAAISLNGNLEVAHNEHTITNNIAWPKNPNGKNTIIIKKTIPINFMEGFNRCMKD